MKQATPPLGRSEKINVALNRPTVNLKEAENLGEEATAVGRENAPMVKFSRHGTFGPNPAHPVADLWGKD